jgi:hypothetical protein
MIVLRKYYLVTGLIVITIFSLLSLENCSQDKKAPANVPEQKRFAGSETCVRCHRAIYEQHLQSFHHLTSARANKQTLKGDFDSANRFYFNDHLFIAAERKQDSFYQTAYSNGIPKLSRPFNIVVGSGKRGQTSIYWFQQYLFELPLTYFTETNEWTISPGYSRKVAFNRSITSRCLECHSTYFQEITNKDSKADEFSKTNFILGVECEKCHGPALEHIAFHDKNPAEKIGHAILNPAKFSRTQRLDLCRLCHGGALSKSKPSFSFQTGDKLFDFFQQNTGKPVSELDVHGNQYGMLAASKCFQHSEMTCLSCHDAHKNESMLAMQFYVKCETCHKSETHNTCKLAATVKQDFLRSNCINCHMPEEASKAITVIRKDESIPTSAHMRSHYISIYKDISKQILSVQK